MVPTPPYCSVLLIALLLPATVGGAEPEIHRCPQPDGTVAFQETPCAEPADDSEAPHDDPAAASTDEFWDFRNPFDETDDPPLPADPAPAGPVSQDRAECEQTTRDAIDAIDLEMRKGYSKEQGEQYLAELLELTRQLRACKQL